MRITFHINFHTVWGQRLYVVGNIPELGSWESAIAKPMTHVGNGDWVLDLEIRHVPESLEYRYLLNADDQLLFEEWERNHVLRLDAGVPAYALFDTWQVKPEHVAFYSSAFTKGFFARSGHAPKRVSQGRKLILKVFAPCVERHHELAILGDVPSLGSWEVGRAIRMDDSAFPEWSVELDAELIGSRFEYKFLVIDRTTGEVVRWETGENRVCDLPSVREEETIVLSGMMFRDDESNWKCAGTVIPLFSLRSEHDFGIGDFGDLRLMVDWAHETGQKILQILPVNDTTTTRTWIDSYPYSAISIYALHPIYLDVSSFDLGDPDRMAYYERIRQKLNAQEAVDYENVLKYKLAYCQEYWARERERIESSDSFRTFREENEDWLMPYATYCYLRDSYGTFDFTKWEGNSLYNKTRVRALCSPESEAWEEISFSYFLQYEASRQFKAASDYARSKQVVLKGDLPIGVNRTGVEAWTEPDYFNMNGQAGAPPDDFSVNGQNWFFPTYNWEAMARDGYRWWKNRFHRLEAYFDCFRVDHILGFFRIWEIPSEYVQGLCGHFNPALPFSVEEIRSYGFHFDEARHARAQINGAYLRELFGEDVEEVINTFLVPVSASHYALKPHCDTQRKVEALFVDKRDGKALRIRDGLYAIANEVLFLRDPGDKLKWHPRILGSASYAYRELGPEDRYAFDQLHWHFFYHRHNDFWKETALRRLAPLLGSTSMLICGEDLGMIPASVPEVMRKEQIFSLEVERMPKSANREFADMFNLPYHSVCTTSTHDMAPLRGWWKEDPGKTQRYYNQVLGHQGEAPAELTAELAAEIVSNHLATRSMLAIIPLQDWFAIDDAIKRPDAGAERVNVPAISPYYWRYRMHLSLERLLGEKGFNGKVARLVRASGR